MMPRPRKLTQSAGVLLYRQGETGLELLLVHPAGNYNRRAPWSIPKGLIDPAESAEVAARRELCEETGLAVAELLPLGSVAYQKSPKEIHAFAARVAGDAEPRPGCWEVDQVRFMSIDEARRLLHPDQTPLIDRLLALLS